MVLTVQHCSYFNLDLFVNYVFWLLLKLSITSANLLLCLDCNSVYLPALTCDLTAVKFI